MARRVGSLNIFASKITATGLEVDPMLLKARLKSLVAAHASLRPLQLC